MPYSDHEKWVADFFTLIIPRIALNCSQMPKRVFPKIILGVKAKDKHSQQGSASESKKISSSGPSYSLPPPLYALWCEIFTYGGKSQRRMMYFPKNHQQGMLSKVHITRATKQITRVRVELVHLATKLAEILLHASHRIQLIILHCSILPTIQVFVSFPALPSQASPSFVTLNL